MIRGVAVGAGVGKGVAATDGVAVVLLLLLSAGGVAMFNHYLLLLFPEDTYLFCYVIPYYAAL